MGAEPWRGADQHMMVIRESIARARPDVVKEVFRLLHQSKLAAKLPDTGTALDALRFGVEPNRQALDVIIDFAFRQGDDSAPFQRRRIVRRHDAGPDGLQRPAPVERSVRLRRSRANFRAVFAEPGRGTVRGHRRAVEHDRGRTPGMMPPLAASLFSSSFMPRWITCGSENTCSRSLIGPAGIAAVSSFARVFALEARVSADNLPTSSVRWRAGPCCHCIRHFGEFWLAEHAAQFDELVSLPVAMMMRPSATGNT